MRALGDSVVSTSGKWISIESRYHLVVWAGQCRQQTACDRIFPILGNYKVLDQVSDRYQCKICRRSSSNRIDVLQGVKV